MDGLLSGAPRYFGVRKLGQSNMIGTRALITSGDPDTA